MRTKSEITNVCTSGGARCRAIRDRSNDQLLAMVCKESRKLWCIDVHAGPISVGQHERCRAHMGELITSYRKAVEAL